MTALKIVMCSASKRDGHIEVSASMLSSQGNEPIATVRVPAECEENISRAMGSICTCRSKIHSFTPVGSPYGLYCISIALMERGRGWTMTVNAWSQLQELEHELR
jgi:hypothetical protein